MIHHSVFRDLLVYPDDSLSDYLRAFHASLTTMSGLWGLTPMNHN